MNNVTNEVIPATSSDESFPPLTVVQDEPTSVEATEIPVEGDIEGLTARTVLVRQQFDADMREERLAQDSAEERQASLLAMGYSNALDWLANRSYLYDAVTKIGLKPAADDAGLLGQIAKLQIGRYINGKWSIPSRRDERLARFYRIFHGNPEKFPPQDLKRVILDFPKRSGGILDSVKANKEKASKEELAENRKLAAKIPPIVKVVKADLTAGPIKLKKRLNKGDYALALVRVAADGLDICQIIEGQDSLTERLTNEWAAEAALTVPSDEE